METVYGALSYFLELDSCWSPLTFIICKIVGWTLCLVIYLFIYFYESQSYSCSNNMWVSTFLKDQKIIGWFYSVIIFSALSNVCSRCEDLQLPRIELATNTIYISNNGAQNLSHP